MSSVPVSKTLKSRGLVGVRGIITPVVEVDVWNGFARNDGVAEVGGSYTAIYREQLKQINIKNANIHVSLGYAKR